MPCGFRFTKIIDMTPTELRELDAWIAEHVMGWKISQAGNSGKNQSGQWKSIPIYTTDPAAALEVLKKCYEKIWSDNPIITKCQHFKIEIWNNGLWVVQQSEKIETSIESETLELAICLFAKKLFSK